MVTVYNSESQPCVIQSSFDESIYIMVRDFGVYAITHTYDYGDITFDLSMENNQCLLVGIEIKSPELMPSRDVNHTDINYYSIVRFTKDIDESTLNNCQLHVPFPTIPLQIYTNINDQIIQIVMFEPDNPNMPTLDLEIAHALSKLSL